MNEGQQEAFEKMVGEHFPKGAILFTLRPNRKMSMCCMATCPADRNQYMSLWRLIHLDTEDNHKEHPVMLNEAQIIRLGELIGLDTMQALMKLHGWSNWEPTLNRYQFEACELAILCREDTSLAYSKSLMKAAEMDPHKFIMMDFKHRAEVLIKLLEKIDATDG